MNEAVSTTAKPEKKATDADVVSAMRGLENAVRELMHISDIAAKNFEDLGSMTSASARQVTYSFTPHELDQFGFLINYVAIRCSALHQAFEAAWHGEALS